MTEHSGSNHAGSYKLEKVCIDNVSDDTKDIATNLMIFRTYLN
jgi:hypothetical protein